MSLYRIILLLSLSTLFKSGYSQETPPPPPPMDTVGVKNGIFERVEVESEFPGGSAGWRKYLETNLNANVPVDNDAPVGIYTVYVHFIVDRDGSITDIKPLTKLGYGMEQEVIRILRKSGSWTPAYQKGKAVKAWKKQPVTFMVTAEDYDITSGVRYVLFTGIDNPVSVKADKVKKSDIQLTISEGTITNSGDGRYIVRVSKPGRAIIEIYNTKKKKPIGKVSFDVKNEKS